MGVTSRPTPRSDAAAASPALESGDLGNTACPSSASRRTMASPMPRLPPVTSTVRFIGQRYANSAPPKTISEELPAASPQPVHHVGRIGKTLGSAAQMGGSGPYSGFRLAAFFGESNGAMGI